MATAAPVETPGTTKLICDGETKNRAAGIVRPKESVKFKLTPARRVGNGRVPALWLVSLRPCPNPAAIEFGATGPARKLAAEKIANSPGVPAVKAFETNPNVTGEHEPISWTQDLREGRFQKQMAIATVISAFFSGFEAWYSHYKNNFRYRAQWTPVIVAPMLMAAGIGAVQNARIAQTWLPALSVVAIVDGGAGFVYHARGVLRRPGGLQKPLYNIIYGPPIFAPLLFAACGCLGLLASLLRREKRK